MNAIPTKTDAPEELDRLLSDFFKSQLRQPWPKAPLPAANATTEPSELATARGADTPHNRPTPAAARRDNTARARFTLAASVALMLGTCWYMSSGFAPGDRPTHTPATNSNEGMLPASKAKGGFNDPLEQINKNKKHENGGVKPEVKLE